MAGDSRQKRVRELIEMARQRISRSKAPQQSSLRSFEILPAVLAGERTQRAVLALRTRGCLWFGGKGRGCSHCGLVQDGLWDPGLDESVALQELEAQLDRMCQKEVRILCLYVAGSFFDRREISDAQRRKVLAAVARRARVRRLVVETRPEFLRPGLIAEAVRLLEGVELEVGIGLDSVDPSVRALCLNKHSTREHFETAARCVVGEGARLLTYAVLKPPFLDESPAIESAVSTGLYAFDLGASSVSLEPLAVQPGTLAHLLWVEKLHRPPWLWSVVEVLRHLAPHGRVRVGGLVVYPSAEHCAGNCSSCSQQFRSVLQDFNLSQRADRLRTLACSCRALWEQELELSRTLHQRLDETLASLRGLRS